MLSLPTPWPRIFSVALLVALGLPSVPARADNFYVTDSANNTVLKYDATGAYLGVFASTHLHNPTGLAFSSSGNLFVANGGTNTISQFNGATGAFVGTFASGGMAGPTGIVFSSSGNLFVANFNSATVSQYSSTGAYVGVFAHTGLNDNYGVAFSSSGNLFVATGLANAVLQFNGTTGALVGNFAYTGLNFPMGIAFSSSGNLFVINNGYNWGTFTYRNTVTQLSPTGAFVSLFASFSPNCNPFFIVARAKDSNFLPPLFYTQPLNQTVTEGANATFAITASASPAFRWQRKPFGFSTFANLTNSGPYSGVATATLAVTSATLAMNGDQFRCLATGVGGTTTSNAATLTVHPHVRIARQPSNATAKINARTTFTVSATGPKPLLYQWLHDGIALKNGPRITGALGPTLALSKITLVDAGNYTVIVTGNSSAGSPVNSATSDPATLTLTP
jgi:hypothetical protein